MTRTRTTRQALVLGGALALVSSLVGSAGCTSPEEEAAGPPGSGLPCTVVSDCFFGELCAQGTCVRPTAPAAAAGGTGGGAAPCTSDLDCGVSQVCMQTTAGAICQDVVVVGSGGSGGSGGTVPADVDAGVPGSGGDAAAGGATEPPDPCADGCLGKFCGEDACGNSCGQCGPGQICTDVGQCEDRATDLPPIVGGQTGTSSRYWDCCKPHCAWPHATSNPVRSCDINNNSQGDWHDGTSGCNGGDSFHCWEMSPWAATDGLAYGWVAFNGAECGACFQLDFTYYLLAGKQMVVQVINTGAINDNQFDILVPGGGVGDFDGCSRQWGTSDLGEQYGGFRAVCGRDTDCVRQMCLNAFGDKPQLMAACDWYIGWFMNANNPELVYQRVPCPSAITSVSGIGG